MSFTVIESWKNCWLIWQGLLSCEQQSTPAAGTHMAFSLKQPYITPRVLALLSILPIWFEAGKRAFTVMEV
jgi:hypothetical protein